MRSIHIVTIVNFIYLIFYVKFLAVFLRTRLKERMRFLEYFAENEHIFGNMVEVSTSATFHPS